MCFYMTMKNTSILSVIIVVKNDRGIKDTLETLHKLPCPISFEVIVVDASLPITLADIKQANPWVRWIQHPYSTKRTTPSQRNLGVEVAKGDLIAFIDANCIPGRKWLESMVAAFNKGEDIVCGPVQDKGKDLVHYAPQLSQPTYVDVCTTISVGIRRSVFEKVGNFDVNFAFGQDVDFMWRATENGYKIYYDPNFSIVHDWGNKDEQIKRAFQYGKARAHLFKKHWSKQKSRLPREVHVWAYPLYILGLPLTFLLWPYPLLALLPVIKNWNDHPFGLLIHHLSYGLGVIVGALKVWPDNTKVNSNIFQSL
jgi:cellulose synthase/poly-beta-1,6-N-acetylglucosamine synthase-like glycosyltransferase